MVTVETKLTANLDGGYYGQKKENIDKPLEEYENLEDLLRKDGLIRQLTITLIE